MGKQRRNRKEECTHLISAKLTDEAFEIYREWRHFRRGGREISNAILAHSRGKDDLKRRKDELDATERSLRSENIQQRSDIESMKKNIAAIQKIITRTFGERDEIAAELSQLYAPKGPE